MKHQGKEQGKMVSAFLLNLVFSVLELAGSFVTGSVAIASDALHDLGDAVTIGIACFLEKKSNRAPDEVYTYGYRRYSVLAGFFGTLMLLIGSLVVIYHAVGRIITPRPVFYDHMLWFSLAGILFNGIAAYITHGGESVNQKAINLHMAEDVLGWIAVFLGAVLIKFTHLWVIDPLLSVGVAVFVMVNAARNLKKSLDILLEKAPEGISVAQIRNLLLQIPGVADVHHIHLWSIDGQQHFATMHLVTGEDIIPIKKRVTELLYQNGISHVTLETEALDEECQKKACVLVSPKSCHHHH